MPDKPDVVERGDPTRREQTLKTHSSELDELIAAAAQVRGRAHAPYSNFHVGAALRDDAGQIHVGCNVENGSFGLTICAERVAVGSAIANGVVAFSALVIVSPGGVPPCGACRQVLAEFCEDLPIWLVNADDDAVTETTLAALFPAGFRFRSE